MYGLRVHVCKQGDGLYRLAETHLVGQDTIETVQPQAHHPANAILLIATIVIAVLVSIHDHEAATVMRTLSALRL